jgi:hypothetical protein
MPTALCRCVPASSPIAVLNMCRRAQAWRPSCATSHFARPRRLIPQMTRVADAHHTQGHALFTGS